MTLELNQSQFEKVATNFILSTTEYQVLKITKSFVNENAVAIVNVRCVNKNGEKLTIKVYVNAHNVCADRGFEYKRTDELLNAELENRSFSFVEGASVKVSKEEIVAAKEKEKQEKAEAKAKKEFDDFVHDIKCNVRNAQDPKYLMRWGYQKAASVKAGAKRSIKRHGIEKLESIMQLLDEKEQSFVQECIAEIEEKEGNEQLMKDIVSRTRKFTPALESVLDQIEASVKGFENQIYTLALKWFAIDQNGRELSKEETEKEAQFYVEMQKARLMYAAVRYLGGLDITSIDNSNITDHRNGFEGVWTLTLADGSKKTFRTHTIIAEGYVQRAHYRYLVNLS
jgi:hypothetical protein